MRWQEVFKFNKKIMILVASLFIWCVLLVGCDLETVTTAQDVGSGEIVAEVSVDTMTNSDVVTTEDLESGNFNVENPSPDYVFSIADVPQYAGDAYVELNGNMPLFSDEEINTDSFESYEELDELGRCGVTFANVSIEIMPTEERGEIGQIKPSGWHTVKYNGLIEGNYLYNRCHLIGYQLSGENDNVNNLITGTRHLNTVGMLPFENQVAEYVKNTENHVLYRVTPVFEGENLVASGVVMEAYSVEDEGEGICFNVFVYNVQPGVIIDYATGDSCLDENYVSDDLPDDFVEDEIDSVGDETTEATTEISEETEIECDYVLNKNTKKFHYPSCSSVDDMKEKNKEYFKGSREEVIGAGYEPCGRCNP